MNCQEVLEFLAAFLDGELSPEQHALFLEHLAECPDCTNYLDSYQQTIRLGRAAFAADEPALAAVPDDLVRAILAARAGGG
jgi:predicted anti-sigma-YlaC factor YlaD